MTAATFGLGSALKEELIHSCPAAGPGTPSKATPSTLTAGDSVTGSKVPLWLFHLLMPYSRCQLLSLPLERA